MFGNLEEIRDIRLQCNEKPIVAQPKKKKKKRIEAQRDLKRG